MQGLLCTSSSARLSLLAANLQHRIAPNSDRPLMEKLYDHRFQRTDQWMPVYSWLELLDTDEVIKSADVSDWLNANPEIRDHLYARHSRYHLMHYIKKCHVKILKRKEKQGLIVAKLPPPTRVHQTVQVKATESPHSTGNSSNARPASSVSKSVSVLGISGKEKSARTPRRFSIPSKSSACSASKSFGNITPIYEARGRRTDSNNGKSDTSVSDVSRSSSRKKFSVLSSASYWLSQIKLSESANKHTISLGFFKLALEAGCEPMQWMKDEFKAYVQRHNMSELGESMKEVFQSYKILEDFEQLQISGTTSEVLSEVDHVTDDDVRSTSSTTVVAEKLQPKAVGIDSIEICQVQKETKEVVTHKNEPMKKNRKSINENITNSQFGSGIRRRGGVQKKPQKPIKQESAKEKDKVKKQGKKATEEGHVNSPPKEGCQNNKENMELPHQIEVVAVAD